MVECLPSKPEAWSSNTNAARERERQRERERERERERRPWELGFLTWELCRVLCTLALAILSW
jgi:hypothetical protein